MISKALVFLKDHLNSDLNRGLGPDDIQTSIVEFVNGAMMDPISFKQGAVSALLINIEEEQSLRAPDRYRRVPASGVPQRVHPEIRLNLYVLFVAHFSEYEDSLRYLSRIIAYFQNHRVLNQYNAPELSEEFEQLVIELVTLPFAAQNEVWNALRTTYHPSVLYKVGLVVFRDPDGVDSPAITEAIVEASA